MGCHYFQTPFHVNLLVAGYDDDKDECQLYAMDYLASMVKTNFSAHGYGGFFSTAILDDKYREGENSSGKPVAAFLKFIENELFHNSTPLAFSGTLGIFLLKFGSIC